MKKRVKRCLISAVVAALLTLATFLLACILSNADGPNIFTIIIAVFFVLASFIHEPSDSLAYLSMYLLFFVFVYGALFIVSKIRKSQDA
jgi:thiol:disulfide interchange protein